MEKLNQLICKVFKIEESELSEHLTSDDISNWDSLTQFGLIAGIETTYHITFEMDELFSMTTIGDIRDILEKKINKTP
jgi:acyl carrier protein